MHILCVITFITTSVSAAQYKSTQEVKNDIINTYDTLFQKESVYNASYAPLRTLVSNLDQYIMGKQGVVIGKKSSGPGKLASQKIHGLGNIFNVWHDNIVVIVNAQIDTIQKLRVSPNDTQARDALESWKDTSWPLMKSSVEKIRAETILDSKKKLADIVLLFIDKNITLLGKALS